jgi:hypothetical protein
MPLSVIRLAPGRRARVLELEGAGHGCLCGDGHSATSLMVGWLRLPAGGLVLGHALHLRDQHAPSPPPARLQHMGHLVARQCAQVWRRRSHDVCGLCAPLGAPPCPPASPSHSPALDTSTSTSTHTNTSTSARRKLAAGCRRVASCLLAQSARRRRCANCCLTVPWLFAPARSHSNAWPYILTRKPANLSCATPCCVHEQGQRDQMGLGGMVMSPRLRGAPVPRPIPTASPRTTFMV